VLIIGSWLGLEVGVVWLADGLADTVNGLSVSTGTSTGAVFLTGFGLRVSGVGTNVGEPVSGLIIGGWLGLEVGVVWLTDGLAVTVNGLIVSTGTSTGAVCMTGFGLRVS
jgi:hypothetical protein